MNLTLDNDSEMEVRNICHGVFAPLTGFMTEQDYRSVVDSMRLPDGSPWSIPITLEVPESLERAVSGAGEVLLFQEAAAVARLQVESVFAVGPTDLEAVYGTADPQHPGIAREMQRSRIRVGGRVTAVGTLESEGPYRRTPAEVRKIFASRGWTTVIGFQTRNAPHRAHEYLQRRALEAAEGLFIQPLVGWKRDGDASTAVITAGYLKMIHDFYPHDRVVFGLLETPMRYAGPREAVFHALIRRNFGCTHFIVGRDHAGVGGYYGRYQAQELCCAISGLGITIVNASGPFYCTKCGEVVTEATCRHYLEAPDAIREISGSMIRSYLGRGEPPPSFAMRPEVAAEVLSVMKTGKA